MCKPSLTQPLLDAFDGLHDPREREQWLSSMRLADFLLRGGSVPEDLRDGILEGLNGIINADANSERHLFSCMSLMLLGQADAEPHLKHYAEHESEAFRNNALYALNVGHD